MQNKPNFNLGKIGVSCYLTSEYEKFVLFMAEENKANSSTGSGLSIRDFEMLSAGLAQDRFIMLCSRCVNRNMDNILY